MATLNFSELVNRLPTASVLALLNLTPTAKGNYLYVPCQNCDGQVAFCSRGEKQNLGYCPKCKKGINILQYAANHAQKPIREVAELLAKQVLKINTADRNKPLELTLELEPHTYPEELCKELNIGYCKKGILSGHLAFEVTKNGTRVAYVGKSIKDNSWKFPKNFDPMSVLYLLDKAQGNHVYLTQGIEDAVCLYSLGLPVASTFGNTFLTKNQMDLLQDFQFITLLLYPDDDVPTGTLEALPHWWRIKRFPESEKEILGLL